MNELVKKDIIKKVQEETITEHTGETETDLWLIIIDLLDSIETYKKTILDLENERDNDYDPEKEIPIIHGPGVSW